MIVKLTACYFRDALPVCGAYAPKFIQLGSGQDKNFVTDMEMDMNNRVVWVTTEGHRTPALSRGRIPVPFEMVKMPIPYVAPVVEKKKEKAA